MHCHLSASNHDQIWVYSETACYVFNILLYLIFCLVLFLADFVALRLLY